LAMASKSLRLACGAFGREQRRVALEPALGKTHAERRKR
jgi:hypothetical protein